MKSALSNKSNMEQGNTMSSHKEKNRLNITGIYRFEENEK